MEDKKVNAFQGELSEEDVASENAKLANEMLDEVAGGRYREAVEVSKQRTANQEDIHKVQDMIKNGINKSKF